MARMFGTDGVRGVANTELTVELAMALGRAGACVLTEGSRQPLFIIGKDTRISGDMLEDALCAGIMSVGGNVIRAGVLPTPGVAYLVKKYNADAGVVISASHNPFRFNGIKFFNSRGLKLDDAVEDAIEDIVKGRKDPGIHVGHDGIGRVVLPETPPLEEYKEFVKSTFDGRLDGIKVVLDCANGASSVLAGDVFRELGADVSVLADDPDGININENCGSTHPENLAEEVVRRGADMGLAFDGDADRLIAVDEKGELVDGDRLIYIIAKYMQKAGRLKDDLVTVTVMSNIGFHRRAKDLHFDVKVTSVGDRYVLESMLETGCLIGGEQSGHIILREFSSTGDGMVAALQLLRAFKEYGIPLSELAGEMKIYPQVLVNAAVRNENKEAYRDDPEISGVIAEMEEKLADTGRVLIRPSGTEPLVRVMLEGENTEELSEMAHRLADLIEAKMA